MGNHLAHIYMDHSTQLATHGYPIHIHSFYHSIVGKNCCKTKSGSGLKTRLILTRMEGHAVAGSCDKIHTAV